MFRIGDFSRIARVSARLLRFYEEIGLFAPAQVDAQTGYRSYSVTQLADLNRIVVLKELGFSLEQVRDILHSDVTPDALRRMLQLRRNDVERTLTEEAQRLRQIEMRIVQLETEGVLVAADVRVREEPTQRLLSLRRTVPSFAAARELIAELRARSRGLLPRGATPVLVAVAHASEFEADALDVEFGYRLEPGWRVQAAEGLAVRELEAVPRMAVCVRVGLPEDAHLVTAKIGRYVEGAGDMLAGASREVFLQPPDLARPHETVVEMQFPIKRRPA